MDRIPRCIQGDGSDDRHLVLRATTCLTSWTFTSEVGIIHLDFSLQNVAIIPLAHRAKILLWSIRAVLYATPSCRLRCNDEILVFAWLIR
jgi:hypothetical protein